MSGNSPAGRLRIATRGSGLALWQSRYVASLLTTVDEGLEVEIVEVSTIGDRDRRESLAQIGGQGVFTREVQHALLDGRADLAVHSLKDLPTDPVEGLVLAGVPARAPRFDAFILPKGTALKSWSEVPLGIRVGTGSPRRRAQVLYNRPDLRFGEIRGNVETRLRKLDAGEFDAIILAEAGLERLELAERISLTLGPPLMYPAVGQGALGIECRADDAEVISLLGRVSDPQTRAEVVAERACLATLRAGCHAPLGVLSEIDANGLALTAVILSLDGRERLEFRSQGAVRSPETVGIAAAEGLLEQGAAKLLTT